VYDSPAARDPLGCVFIVTYGRSGSTLLQGILNSIPGYVIRGENGDSLYSLFAYFNTLDKAHREHTDPAKKSPDTPSHPWFGINQFSPETTLALLRSLVLASLLQPPAGTRVTGFKEIRWVHSNWRPYADFLIRLFPRARFIINTRDHTDVLASKWWKDRENGAAILDRAEVQFAELEAAYPNRTYRVHYNDYTADSSSLEGMFKWLGEPFDKDRVDDVLTRKHSY
jgi:hypothetical protein